MIPEKIKYNDPLNQIQDQIGVRIIVHYLDDVKSVSDVVIKNFGFVEKKNHS